MVNGGIFSLTSFIGPCVCSYLFILSANALYRRLAFCGVNMILDFTFALGEAGISLIKSTINSVEECAITAKFE